MKMRNTREHLWCMGWSPWTVFVCLSLFVLIIENMVIGRDKIGIKCFSRILLVAHGAHGRRPSKPHFHGPIRQRISEEDIEETCEDFSKFYLPSQNATRTKNCWKFPTFFWRYLLARCLGIQVWMPVKIPHAFVEIERFQSTKPAEPFWCLFTPLQIRWLNLLINLLSIS